METINYSILYSQPYEFFYDEKFHPKQGTVVAQRGWRAVVKASFEGFSDTCEAILGLNQSSTEGVAKEFARAGVMAKFWGKN